MPATDCAGNNSGVERAEIVTPAKAGAQRSRFQQDWIPTCAGMTATSNDAVPFGHLILLTETRETE